MLHYYDRPHEAGIPVLGYYAVIIVQHDASVLMTNKIGGYALIEHSRQSIVISSNVE
jgi:hypothetical protein